MNPEPSEPGRSLHVLVVDDSAVVRMLLSRLLAERGGMRVETAADPLIAMSKMAVRRPDVIVLDLEMPRMDGLTFLRRVMSEDPLPVVICSSHAGRGTGAAVEALVEGAVDVVAKPRLGVSDFLQESALLIVDAVRGAAEARLRRRGLRPPAPPLRASPSPQASSRGVDVVAVGVSTWGPEALEVLLAAQSRSGPGLVVVQHMPERFTAALARRLDSVCSIDVREGRAGDALRPGCALLAPGGRHMELRRRGRGYVIDVTDGPLVTRHRPSVDVLFRSVAREAGAAAVGVILTGMGEDGAAGLSDMRRAGARTIAQDEESCVVFGMPKVAVERGAAAEVMPLSRIAELLGQLGPPP